MMASAGWLDPYGAAMLTGIGLVVLAEAGAAGELISW